MPVAESVPVHVIDSRSVSAGLGTMVLEAARAARESADVTAVMKPDPLPHPEDPRVRRPQHPGEPEEGRSDRRGGRHGRLAVVHPARSRDLRRGVVEEAGKPRTRKPGPAPALRADAQGAAHRVRSPSCTEGRPTSRTSSTSSPRTSPARRSASDSSGPSSGLWGRRDHRRQLDRHRVAATVRSGGDRRTPRRPRTITAGRRGPRRRRSGLEVMDVPGRRWPANQPPRPNAWRAGRRRPGRPAHTPPRRPRLPGRPHHELDEVGRGDGPGAEVERIGLRCLGESGDHRRTELPEGACGIGQGVPDVGLNTLNAVAQTLRVTVTPDTRPRARRSSRRTTPCWSIPPPSANVAHTVRSVRFGPSGLQKNSRLLAPLDRGAVTTTVPRRGLL